MINKYSFLNNCKEGLTMIENALASYLVNLFA